MTSDRLVKSLTELGFSTYEARAYVGLLKHGPGTGYALANATGIPQPKVYETLQRLTKRGAAVQVSEEPARYSALPAEKLLERLTSEFKERVSSAQAEVEGLWSGGKKVVWHEPLIRIEGLDPILDESRTLITEAEERLYISGWGDQLTVLREELVEAARRDVLISVLHFGGLHFEIPFGQTVRHASTEGVLYPRHRSRQLAVVADSSVALWALSRDSEDWSAAVTKDGPLVSVVKAYIRHDIYVQRIYHQLGPEMHAEFGRGLERLTDLSSESLPGRDEGKRAAG